MTNHTPISQVIQNLKAPWENNTNTIWLASTVKIARNLEKFNFPNKLDTGRKKQLLELISKPLSKAPQLTNPIVLPAEAILPIEKDFLTEHFLLFEAVQDVVTGGAFVLDATGKFAALINIKDHLFIQMTDCSENLDAAWQTLVKIEKELAKTISFAFSNTFGFLTQDPMICGTALTISSYLHVPMLIHQNLLQDILEEKKMDDLLTTGLQGNPRDLIGDILLVRNSRTLGITEEGIITSLKNHVLHLVKAERQAREAIKKKPPAGIMDKMSRSLGTLKFSYTLETAEALAALSLVKLGIEIGYMQGMTVSTINKLFFNTRRGHLCAYLKDNLPNDALPTSRATFLRQMMEGVTLSLPDTL